MNTPIAEYNLQNNQYNNSGKIHLPHQLRFVTFGFFVLTPAPVIIIAGQL